MIVMKLVPFTVLITISPFCCSTSRSLALRFSVPASSWLTSVYICEVVASAP